MKTLFTLLIIMLLMFTACQQVDNSQLVNNSSGSEEIPGEHGGPKMQAQAIAEKFVRESPTYSFDGSNLELISSQTNDCVNVCDTFVFTFTSAHGGYGDREGEVMTQAITPHRAVVTVIGGEVYGAALDDRWDMLVQAERGDAPPGSE